MIDRILAKGADLCDEVEVFFTEGESVSAELKRSIVGEAHAARSWGIGIRTIRDGRIGASSTNDPSRWEDCLDAAIAGGTLATPQEWHGLPGPVTLSGSVPVFDPNITVAIEPAREMLRGLLAGAASWPVDVIGGSAGLSRSSVAIANSAGVHYTSERTGVGVSLEAIAGTSTGYEFDRSRFLDIDPFRVGEQAAFFAARSAGGGDIATGSYDVILSPVAVAQLLGNVLVPALSGRNVHAGRSFLAGKLGEQVLGETISVVDDPFARGMGSTLFDAEGVPTRRLAFIEEGVLSSYAYDLRTAYRYSEKTTASAVRGGAGGSPSIGIHNLLIEGPRHDIADERAVYAHDLVGAHTANPVTGDFSVELSNAFWMEGGDYAEPIRKAMLAGNVFSMFGAVDGLGRESRVVGSMILPPVRFKSMQVIGT
ncbi:MAG: TldD/PmbA family protein [Methanomicrobiales archaeon]|nr:TldD/PmbA family protein [Methanomicrobiales archaeon]